MYKDTTCRILFSATMPVSEPAKSSDSPPLDASFTTGGIQKHQDDVVIAVVGRTGTGKSSFIRLVSGDPSVKIGDDLESETSEIQVVRFTDSSGRNVVIVDTPGFGDSRTGVSDAVILKKITAFLLESYDENRKLNGIIYLHRIKDTRFNAQSNLNLQIFAGLCGARNFKNVVVLTTFWDRICAEEGARREAQLKSMFFKELIDGGACLMRHDRTMETARDVFDHIFRLLPTNVQIQEEIRVRGKSLQETAAGSIHGAEVERLKVEHQKQIENLEHALKKEAEASNKLLQDEVENLRQQLVQRDREVLQLGQGLTTTTNERDMLQRERETLQRYLETMEERNALQKQNTQLQNKWVMWQTCLEFVKLVGKGLDWYVNCTAAGE